MTFAGAPAGYVLGKQLKAGPIGRVYAATREGSGALVILKCFGADGEGYERAQRELEALRSLTHDGVPWAIELLLQEEVPVLIMERSPGVRLDHWAEREAREVESVVRVALALSKILVAVHESHLVHRDLIPEHVLVTDDLRVSLIDFGRAQLLGSVVRGEVGVASTGMPLYAAPEQSGLINHGCDYRTDLYALGATLYHALCGRPPFALLDVRELLHAHVTRRPDAPHEVRPEIPEPLSRLVMKLLSKEPDDRYQRAQAVQADLESMLEQLRGSGGIDPDFELATSDAPDRPHFKAGLYGRDAEMAALERAYDQAAGGTPHMVWLRGEAGAGKSALLEAFRLRVGARGGYFARAKFDAYQERPYATCAQAIDSLVHQMLVESDVHLARWRRELRESLGNIAAALTPLVPDLDAVLGGDVPPVPKLGPRETQARLALALRRFLRVVATSEHPLVLCFDDLQWIDAGSRVLLSELLCREGDEESSLLLLGAYRPDAEGQDPREIEQLRTRVEQHDVTPARIAVGVLDLDATTDLLADALGRSADAVRPLAVHLGERMGYRPLLIRQFVEHLAEQGLLRYLHGQGWDWDPEELASASIPDEAVGLLSARIHRLDPDARAVLEFASCMGAQFDAFLLDELGCRVEEGVRSALYRLAEAGLIAVCAGGFRFTHDRLRETARDLLSEEDRTRLHYGVGRILLEAGAVHGSEARIFEAADHLSRGLAHLEPELRVQAIELELEAGRRALAAGSGTDADRYLKVAHALTVAADAESYESLFFEVRIEGAEAALQCGDTARALEWLAELDAIAQDDLRLARLASKRIAVLSLVGTPEECLAYALGVLGRLGVRWPRHPSGLRTVWALWRTRRSLRGRSGEQLLAPAPQLDPRRLAVLMVAGASAPARAKIDTKLSALVVAELLHEAGRLGYLAPPSYLLASYATYVQMVLGDAATSRRFSAEALDWLRRAPDPVFDNRVQMHVYALLRPWLASRRSVLAPLERVALGFRESGDREWVNYARFIRLALGALAGTPIAETARAFDELDRDVERAGHRYPEPGLARRPYALLAVAELVPERLEAELAASERELVAQGEGGSESFLRTLWMLVLCVYGRYDLVHDQVVRMGSRLLRATGYAHVADHVLLRGLASSELGLRTRGLARRRHRQSVLRDQRLLERWARHGADFVHMATLLRAESARLRSDSARALALYEQAAEQAQAYVPHAALAIERRAQLAGTLRRAPEALASLRRATDLYADWGAKAKVAELARTGVRARSGS